MSYLHLGSSENMCRDPYSINKMGFWGVSTNFNFIFIIITVNYICLINQLI